MVTATLRPRGPYSFRLSTRHGSDATRRVRDGIYTAMLPGGLERVRAWQPLDGAVHVQAASEAGVEHVRFVLGLDDDHSEFLRRFADDPLIGEATRRFRGLRPLRTATVAQALLRARRRPADHVEPRARRSSAPSIRAATPAARRACTRRPPRPTSGASRRPSSSGSASAPGAARRSFGSAGRSTSRAQGASDRGRRATARARARARAVVGRRRLPRGARPLRARARPRPRPRQARLGALGAAASRRRRPTRCSRRTRSGPGSRACTCWRDTAPDS